MSINAVSSIFAAAKERQSILQTFTFEEYLNFCKAKPQGYASIHTRLLSAIGNPTVIKTINDSRLDSIHMGKEIKIYDTFSDFYGAEAIEAVERLVSFLRAASQGLEEAKQILYFLGPVGSAKSSMAERLKDLAEKEPFYVLAYKQDDGTLIPGPLYESPLGLIPRDKAPEMLHHFDIPKMFIKDNASPWAVKRQWKDFDGDIGRFHVLEMMPSRLKQIGIAKVEPGDDNNQDISTLTGKVDVRMLEEFSQDDPDAYSYSGGLNRSTQGLLEFVEMFKAPLKTLHPLLTATQEGNYNGTEAVGAMPFQGLILAHSNEQEWASFQQNKKNEAFLDRVRTVKVRYNLRLTEEQAIYRKMLDNSTLAKAPQAPYALEFLARVAVASRLDTPTTSSLISKVLVYDGQNLKDEDPKAKSHQDYINDASRKEGFSGLSPRFQFKVISDALNTGDEISLDVIEMLQVLTREVRNLDLDDDYEATLLEFIDEQKKGWFYKRVDEDIKKALLENYDGFAQNRFERYFYMADNWCQDKDYKDPETGHFFDRAKLDAKLSEVEKPAGIANPKDYRQEVVNWVLRNSREAMPRWDASEKIRKVIQHVITKNTEDLTPILSYEAKRNTEDEKKFESFQANMRKYGYTDAQVRRLVGWYNDMKVGN